MSALQICSDFCEWYKLLGGSDAITEENVADLFAIRIPPYKTSDAAKCLDLQSISRKAVLQINGYDIKEKAHQRRPKVNAPAIGQPPTDLTSFQSVFGDIMNLKITQGYCHHLFINKSGEVLPDCLKKTVFG
jgi:hypothetical protein